MNRNPRKTIAAFFVITALVISSLPTLTHPARAEPALVGLGFNTLIGPAVGSSQDPPLFSNVFVFTGNASAVVSASPVGANQTTTAATLSVSIPSGSTIAKAFLYTNGELGNSTDLATAYVNGVPVGTVSPYVSSLFSSFSEKVYKWDVTATVSGPGTYAVNITRTRAHFVYFVAMAVVFTNPALPVAQVILNDGQAEEPFVNVTSSTTFNVNSTATGEGSLIVTSYGDNIGGTNESASFNSLLLASGDIWNQSIGGCCFTLRSFPLSNIVGGANTLTLTTGSDALAWPLAILTARTTGVPSDIDGDGLPDSYELSPEMQALGADPCRKTIAVQIDYMPGHLPFQAALDMVRAAFDAAPVNATLPCPYTGFPRKPTGINLIIQVVNQIPYQAALNFSRGSPDTFESIKARFFNPNRLGLWHYCLFVNDLAQGSSVSGVGELHGDDFIVSLGEQWTNGTGTVLEQAGTFMHELGHNTGLDHGGGDELNFKPNYPSVMNYAFQVVGLTSLALNGSLVTRLDYSRLALPSLDEASLNEVLGVSGLNGYTSWTCPNGNMRTALGNGPVDWNCDGSINTGTVRTDINQDTSIEMLNGYNDWMNLDYIFTDEPSFLIPGAHDLPMGKDLDAAQAAPIEQFWKEFSSLHVSEFFTDGNGNPLPVDSSGNPSVNVVLANGRVSGTNPGQILAWVNATNRAGSSVQSLMISETLPVDWAISPSSISGKGSVRVFFVFRNGTRTEITPQTTVSASTSNPQTVLMTIASMNATTAGKPLQPGESILLSVKLTYVLKGTSQLVDTYPRNYSDASTGTAFSRPMLAGTAISDTARSFFVASAKVVGGSIRVFGSQTGPA